MQRPPFPVLLEPPTLQPAGHSPLQKGAVPDQKFWQKLLAVLHWHHTFDPEKQQDPPPQLSCCIAVCVAGHDPSQNGAVPSQKDWHCAEALPNITDARMKAMVFMSLGAGR